MVLLNLLRYLRGTVQFTATGGFTERFLNLAARKGINLWDVGRRGESIEAKVLAHQYKALRECAKKTGVRLKSGSRVGAPFQMHRYRKRIGILIGVLLFVAFLFFMSFFVWSIELKGMETIPEEKILAQLEELGVRVGAPKWSIDFTTLEDRMLLAIPELSQVAITTKGTSVWIEVRERAQKPEMIDEDQPNNVIAAKTGQIKKLEVLEGMPMVEKGQAVAKGDLLVSGIVEDKYGGITMRHAMATVIAETQTDFTIEIPLQQTIPQKTGKEFTRSSIRIFRFDLPLYIATRPDGQYERSRSVDQLEIFGYQLPFYWVSDQYTELEMTPITYTEKEAEALALAQLEKQITETLPEAVVIEQENTVTVAEGVLTLHSVVTCEENIAQNQEILIDE